MCLNYFGRRYRAHKSAQDLEAYKHILKDTKFMQMHVLTSQHLDYMVQGLLHGVQILHHEDDIDALQSI